MEGIPLMEGKYHAPCQDQSRNRVLVLVFVVDSKADECRCKGSACLGNGEGMISAVLQGRACKPAHSFHTRLS